MPEIQVIFPAPNTKIGEVVTTARVLEPTLIAHDHDHINWTFYSCDDRIKYAEVEFADPNHKFFPTGNVFGKALTSTENIYGDVPGLGAPRPVLAKYTVRGLDGDPNGLTKPAIMSELDPEILINEP